MFAVLESVPERRRRLPFRRTKSVLRPERVPVPGGASFFLLRVPTARAVPWQALQRAVGTLPVLLPQGMRVPDGTALRVFTPRRFPLLCAARTAADALRARGSACPSLGVLDPYGVLCGETACLLSAARDVRIVTDRPERFSADVRFAMREYGAALTVARKKTLLCGCTAIVCENGGDAPAGSEAVFCVNPGADPAAAEVSPRIQLRAMYAALCPQGTDPFFFAAALYELCGVRTPDQRGNAGFSAQMPPSYF